MKRHAGAGRSGLQELEEAGCRNRKKRAAGTGRSGMKILIIKIY